ncbi:DUF4349 domain-containing protein [uncultured Allomuricauda sp.]|uniref:DUF4349 domain-containing protein n=1 Tax=Flagellimonas sp. W118 TaxID=3410791 RepID=UPI00262881C6|nr:DUF4349 domain-containing protein [uncultured Allomuricauda sp.]
MKTKVAKRFIKLSALLIGFGYISSCGNESYQENALTKSVDISKEFEVISNTNISDETSSQPSHIKIIKSAEVRYKVKHVKKASKLIKSIAHEYDGYVSDMRFENNLHSLENRFTLKVPQAYFDRVMDTIVHVAEFVDYENITSKDVTEEFIDVKTRLKTKLEVKSRYETVLREKAKTVEDILAAEGKLQVIQEEIEASQGKLKYLTNKISFSTIQIDLYETVNYKEEPDAYEKSFWSRGKEGVVFGWHFVENTILAIVYIWPILLVGVTIFVLYKHRRARK